MFHQSRKEVKGVKVCRLTVQVEGMPLYQIEDSLQESVIYVIHIHILLT